MSLPTIDQVIKQAEEAHAKKKGAQKVEEEAVEQTGTDGDESLDTVSTEAVEPASVVAEEDIKEEPVKKPDPFAKRFAALTRLDKERRQKEHELAQRMQDFERRQKEFESRSSYKPADALDALKHHGFTYDDAVYRVLGAQAPEKEIDPVEQKMKTHLDPLGQKMKTIEDKLAELDAATKRFNDQQEQQAARELEYGLKAVITDGEYPYISGLGDEAFSLVYDTLVGSYSDPSSKQKLTYKQACDKVESYYKRIGSIGSTKTDTVTDTKAPVKKQPATEAAKTLTQAHSASLRSNKQATIDKMGKFEAIDEVAKLIRYHTNR